jgi:nitrate reductase gamma subunit
MCASPCSPLAVSCTSTPRNNTWRSGSSQLLRKRQFRWGSNLFHVGILVVIGGHFAGFLMPDWAVDWLISPVQHELLAMVVGGLAGLIAIIGLSLLMHRRLTDPNGPPAGDGISRSF